MWKEICVSDNVCSDINLHIHGLRWRTCSGECLVHLLPFRCPQNFPLLFSLLFSLFSLDFFIPPPSSFWKYLEQYFRKVL